MYKKWVCPDKTCGVVVERNGISAVFEARRVHMAARHGEKFREYRLQTKDLNDQMKVLKDKQRVLDAAFWGGR